VAYVSFRLDFTNVSVAQLSNATETGQSYLLTAIRLAIAGGSGYPSQDVIVTVRRIAAVHYSGV
jgi:hypothetical protein